MFTHHFKFCPTLFSDYKSSCVSPLRHAFYLLGMKCIVGIFVVQMWAKPSRVLRYQNWLTENSELPLASNPTWICIVHPFKGYYNLVLLWKLHHLQVDIIFKAPRPLLSLVGENSFRNHSCKHALNLFCTLFYTFFHTHFKLCSHLFVN